MLEFFKAKPMHLTNKKLNHRAWLAYCVIELYGGPSRLMKGVIPRLRQHLDADEAAVVKTVKELETVLRVYPAEAEEGEKPKPPWMVRPFDGKTIQLMPAPDDGWVKLHNWLPLAQALEIWERRLLAYLLVPSRRYPYSQNRRQLNLQGINENCRIPGRSRVDRKKALRTTINRFKKLGLIARLGDMHYGRAGWVEFDFKLFDALARAETEHLENPTSRVQNLGCVDPNLGCGEAGEQHERTLGSEAPHPTRMQQTPKESEKKKPRHPVPQGGLEETETPTTSGRIEAERVAAFWKAIQGLPRYEPRRAGIEAEPRIIRENLLGLLHPQATPEDLKSAWSSKDFGGLKFICQQLVSSSIGFRERLVEAITRAVEARLKQEAESQRLVAEGPREIFGLAWKCIQAAGRGFHPDSEDGESLLARVLILDYPEVRPSVQVVEVFRELRDGSRDSSKYWLLKPPDLLEAENVMVFETWLAALRTKDFYPLPRPLCEKLQKQKYETDKEKARRLREDEIRANIGKEPLPPVLQKLLEKLKGSQPG